MQLNLLKQIRSKASQLTCSNPLYDWTLGGAVPDGFSCVLHDDWAGDAEQGQYLCDGQFVVDEACVDFHEQGWNHDGLNPLWITRIHGFSWLRDLKALGGDTALRCARDYVRGWMETYHKWDEVSWAPGIAGQRIANWIALYSFYGQTGDEEFQHDLMDSMHRQARHIARCLGKQDLSGLSAFYASKGLVFAGLVFDNKDSWLTLGLDRLEIETKKQVLSDGGHISRSPETLMRAIKILMDIRAGLQAGEYPVPAHLDRTIDKMVDVLRFFRYPDKSLAVFHGGQDGQRPCDANLTEAMIRKSSARNKIPLRLENTGYDRLVMGRSLLMVDTAYTPPSPYDRNAHAAPLAFEFMYGKEKIFVNGGSHPTEPDWRDVLRGTAAHNSMTIDYRNAAEILSDGHLGRRARKVSVHREDKKDAALVEASHDGYIQMNGITHRRRLYLGNHGHDLRGEESLTCSIGMTKPSEIALRFHLHPRVKVSLIQDGAEALLRLPGGAGWRFFNQGGQMSLENSIYLGTGTRPAKTKQLVLYGLMHSDVACIKWALQRESF